MSSIPAYNGKLTLAFQARDRKVAADWYARHLGFELMYDSPEIGWCEMATGVANGDVSVGFSEVEEPRPGGPVPTFGVKDLDAARAGLEKAGVRFDGETLVIEGLVKLATFFDPVGNSLMLAESLSESA